MTDKSTASIYRIYDPRRPDVTRYIGQTRNSLLMRLAGHIHQSRKTDTPQARWVAALIREGVRPEIELVETVFCKEANSRERYWIKQHRAAGSPLNNVSNGLTSNIYMGRREDDPNTTQNCTSEQRVMDGGTGTSESTQRNDQRRRTPFTPAIHNGGELDLKRNRTFRVDSDAWDLFTELAKLHGVTTSAALRKAIELYEQGRVHEVSWDLV